MSFPDGVIYVKSGDIELGMWGIAKDLMAINESVIWLEDLLQCTPVSDRHEEYQTGVGRLAGGILGGVLLGPIGAVGGILVGGQTKIDETIVFCTLADGRTFSGEVSQLTSARLQQIASRNAKLNLVSPSLSQPVSDLAPSVSGLETECPMCAELIKAKAKICRYCGYKIFEEKEKFLLSLQSNSLVESTFNVRDGIQSFRSSSALESSVSDEVIVEILECFSRLRKSFPEKNYRLLADEVKTELNIEFKTLINEIVREGFKFLRTEAQFDVNDGIIVIWKKAS